MLKSKNVPVEHIVATLKNALSLNAGDEATEKLLFNLGSEILDCSPDTLLELLGNEIC